jgi:uncharacterized protein (DUF305 family)
MAEPSEADKSFVDDMTAHHKAAVATAQKYLDAAPGQRRANLSEMARMIVKRDTAEMAQMRTMMGSGGMGKGM